MSVITRRTVGAMLLTFTLAACTRDLTAPANTAPIALKNGVSTPPASAGVFSGYWVETGVPVFDIGGGRAQQIWIEFSITGSGSSYSGTANRYVRYWQNGVITSDRIDLGTPGRVSATVTATGLQVFVTRVGEQKLNFGYDTRTNTTSDTLTVIAPKTTGGSAFVKR